MRFCIITSVVPRMSCTEKDWKLASVTEGEAHVSAFHTLPFWISAAPHLGKKLLTMAAP